MIKPKRVIEILKLNKLKKRIEHLPTKKKVLLALATVITTVFCITMVSLAVVKTNADGENPDSAYARTVFLEKGSLEDLVTLNGNVGSARVSVVTSELESKVTAVHVKVGDKVNAGDVICELDTTEITKQIREKKKQLAEEKTALKQEVKNAQASLDNISASRKDVEASNDALISNAKKAQKTAAANYRNKETSYNSALKAYNNGLTKISKEQAGLTNAAAERQNAYEAWKNAGFPKDSGNSSYDVYCDADERYRDAQERLETAQAIYGIEGLKSSLEYAGSALNDAGTALSSANEAVEAARANKTSALKEIDSSVNELTTAKNEAKRKINSSSSDLELEELKEKKKDAVLKAETDGEVTAFNVHVGSKASGEIAKIQATDDLILTVQTPEAFINKVNVGQHVRITAASLKSSVEGEVISKSNTMGDNIATEGSSQAGDSTAEGAAGQAEGYLTIIKINRDSGLRVGAKVKAEIILSSKENVYMVPIDAVVEDENGNSVIKVIEKGKVSDVVVKKGKTNDYYVEITGKNIKEKMEVLADGGGDTDEAISD